LRPAIADGPELVVGFDPLGHDGCAELVAQVDDHRDEHLPARPSIEILDQRSVQLDDCGFEIRDELQVGVTSAQIVDHQVRARAGADFAQHAHAQVEVGERHRFGDLQINVVVMRENGIIGADEPAVLQLVGMQVEEDRGTAAQRDADFSDHPSEPSRGSLRAGVLEERGGCETGNAASNERVVRMK